MADCKKISAIEEQTLLFCILKILVFVIAEGLRMVTLNLIQKNVKSKTSKQKQEGKNNQLADFLRLPYESLHKSLTGLRGLVTLKHYSTNAFTFKTLAKKKLDTLILLEVQLPPKVFYQFRGYVLRKVGIKEGVRQQQPTIQPVVVEQNKVQKPVKPASNSTRDLFFYKNF